MSPHIARSTAWLLVAIYFILSATGIYLQALTNTAPGDIAIPLLPYFFVIIVVGIWPMIGAKIISHHPRHPVGWLLFATFPLIAIVMFAVGYASYATNLAPDLLPLPGVILFWLKGPGLPTTLVALALMYLLFPTGKLLSPRWQAVAWASLGILPVIVGLLMVIPGPLNLFPGLENPDAVSESVWVVLAPLYLATVALLTMCNLAALISLFLRMRHRQGDEAQQVKWLIIPATVYWIGIPLNYLGNFDLSGILLNLGVGLHLVSVPGIVIAVAFAIFRYHLYDIDILINRTLVYSTLTACIVGFYVLIVGALGTLFQAQGNLIIALLATGLVAVLFQPLREWLQRGVNRLIYGERDDPFEALSRLGREMESALPPDQLLPALVETIAQTLKLPFVGIAIQNQLVAVYGHPTEHPTAFPLTYQGETTGELRAAPRGPDEAFTPAEMRLLRNLARQAGAAVRNAQLTADLQRSRQTLVTAREEERHRLRRDLHDGIGPTLAGLTLKLDATKELIASSLETGEPANLQEVVQLLAQLKSQTQEAVRDIRHIVHALRPPSLDVLGLAPALHAHFGQVAAPTNLTIQLIATPKDFPRLSAAVEVAAYRIVLEAVTNVIHHAKASVCRVSLTLENGHLQLTVTDNGIGIPPQHNFGVGLNSMRERAEELGGRFELNTSPKGTCVCAQIPML